MENTYLEVFKNYPEILTVKDLTLLLGIGKSTAYSLVRAGKIKSVKTGKDYLIPKLFVFEYLGIIDKEGVSINE